MATARQQTGFQWKVCSMLHFLCTLKICIELNLIVIKLYSCYTQKSGTQPACFSSKRFTLSAKVRLFSRG